MRHDEARAVLARLLDDIAPGTDLDAVDPDQLLQDELALDSIDVVRLLEALYEATGVDVPPRDLPALATLGGFVAYVAERA